MMGMIEKVTTMNVCFNNRCNVAYAIQQTLRIINSFYTPHFSWLLSVSYMCIVLIIILILPIMGSLLTSYLIMFILIVSHLYYRLYLF